MPEPESAAGSRTIVLGLGNPLLSDDAVGLAVAHMVRLKLADSPDCGVDVLTSTRAGFELLELLSGYGRAIIVDALDIPGGVPGRIVRQSLADYAGSARLHNAHEISVSAAYVIASQLGVPMPQQTAIIGIETADVRTISEELTPAVKAAILPAADLVIALLAEQPQAMSESEAEFAPAARAFYPPDWPSADPR